MAEYESRHWTCEEFEKALPDLFERAEGGKLSADPRFADILRDCPQVISPFNCRDTAFHVVS